MVPANLVRAKTCSRFAKNCCHPYFAPCCYRAPEISAVASRELRGLEGQGLRTWEAEVVRQAGAFADCLVLQSNPAVQACRRMRLPDNYLYIHRSAPVSTHPFQQVS